MAAQCQWTGPSKACNGAPAVYQSGRMSRLVPPLFLLLAACDSCGSCGGEDLRVEGDHPYVRCTAVEPQEREWDAGGLHFVLEDRTLTIEGEVPHVVAFALAPDASFDALPEAPLRIVLGGFARDEASSTRLLRALAEKGPTLLLPGGEDDTEVLDAALADLDAAALVDLRGIHRLRFGGHEWVPVPGAPDGRYARGANGCGYDAEDLAALDLAEAEEPRHLLSWAAPTAAGPLARGLDGVGVGTEALDALSERVGATGGIHGWPRREAAAVHAPPESESHVAVPVWGRIVEGPDGSWSRGGVAAVELEDGALHLAR
jgi:hypothetical protein